MFSRIAPLTVLFAVACAPQSAEITSGTYHAFLSDSTSLTLNKGSANPVDWETSYNVDCRDFDNKEEKQVLQLEDPLKICKDWEDRNGDGQPAPEWESWMGQSAFHVVTEELEPWRGEAIINSEGDLQITFHHHLPGGADFRFTIAVDPDFAPQECVVDGSGTGVQPIDGDWLTEWTKDLRALGELDELPPAYAHLANQIDTGTLYYLNARAYQFDPADVEESYWDFPEHFQAGYAGGKFAEELFHSRSPRFGQPGVWDAAELDYTVIPTQADLFFCFLEEGDVPADSSCMNNKIEEATSIADGIQEEYADVLAHPTGGESGYRPLVHDNLWRAPDGFTDGLDGWVGLHFNYVAITGKIEVGEPISGAFSLILDGDDSNSRFVIQGEFDVPKIKKDRWTTDDLQAIKLEENGNEMCVIN